MPNSFQLDNFNSSLVDNIGFGIIASYDNAKVMRLIDPTDIQFHPGSTGSAEDKLEYSYYSSQEQITNALSVTSSGRAKFSFGDASSKAAYREWSRVDSYSIYILGYKKYIRGYYELRPGAKLAEHVEKEIKRLYKRDKPLLIPKLGEKLINKVIVGQEIAVKLTIQTESEASKKAVMAELGASNMGNSINGEGHWLKKIANRSSSIKLDVAGSFSDGNFHFGLDPSLIFSTLSNIQTNDVKVIDFEAQDLNHVAQLGAYDFNDYVEFNQRKNFSETFKRCYSRYSNWKANIMYMMANKLQFDHKHTTRAHEFLADCEARMATMQGHYDHAWAQWMNTGQNEGNFDVGVFAAYDEPIESSTYKRLR